MAFPFLFFFSHFSRTNKRKLFWPLTFCCFFCRDIFSNIWPYRKFIIRKKKDWLIEWDARRRFSFRAFHIIFFLFLLAEFLTRVKVVAIWSGQETWPFSKLIYLCFSWWYSRGLSIATQCEEWCRWRDAKNKKKPTQQTVNWNSSNF